MRRAVSLSLLLFIFPTHATNKPNHGFIRSIRSGSAQLSTDKGRTWKKAHVGDVFAANYAFRTDTNGVIDLFLGQNGPALRLSPNTTLGIDKLDINSKRKENVTDTQLDLRHGRIYGHVQNIASESKYEIKAPFGVSGIRGTNVATVFSIASSGEIQVVEGLVVEVFIVSGVPIPPQIIQSGQQLRAPVSGATPPLVTTLPADDPVRAECATLLDGITLNADGSITVKIKNPFGPDVTITAPAKRPLPLPPPGTVSASEQIPSTERVYTVTKPARAF